MRDRFYVDVNVQKAELFPVNRGAAQDRLLSPSNERTIGARHSAVVWSISPVLRLSRCKTGFNYVKVGRSFFTILNRKVRLSVFGI